MQKRGKKKKYSYKKYQNMKLEEMRFYIRHKIISFIVFMVVLMVILWGIMSIVPPPEKWEQKQITYSNIAIERGARGKKVLLYTTDGDRYILSIRAEEMELLSQQLIPEQQYSVTYYKALFNKIARSLSSHDRVFIELNKSVTEWENEQKIFHIICAIIICSMPIGSATIYALGCKRERQEIEKIKAKMEKQKYV